MKAIYLKNTSNITQCVFDTEGRRIELGAYAVGQFRGEEASLLLEECGHCVREYQPTSIPEVPGELVWVANVSGSPFLPRHVRIKVYNRNERRWEDTNTPNLVREPQPFVGSFNLNQDAKGRNLGRRPVEIPPYYRLPVPKTIASWLLMRCQHTLPENRGIIRECRAPTDFEPTMAWDLDDLIMYGMMLDKNFHIDHSARSKADLKNDEYEIDKEVQRLVNILFFYVVDERYNLPTKNKFEAYKKREIGLAQARAVAASKKTLPKAPAGKLVKEA